MENFSRLDLVALRNLWMEEARFFLDAVGAESSSQLEGRLARLKAIDQVIQLKKSQSEEAFTKPGTKKDTRK